MDTSDVSTGGCIVICVILAVLSFLEAWVVQLLWNWIAPIFWQAAPTLTYWQAFGACVLLSIIGSAFRSISK